MKLAIIGSRTLVVDNLDSYLPENITEIVSGGAKGIDQCARKYALSNNIPLKEFLPDYSKYGRTAPLKRNLQIVEYADEVLAFWDGHSTGTIYTLKEAHRQQKRIHVYRLIR